MHQNQSIRSFPPRQRDDHHLLPFSFLQQDIRCIHDDFGWRTFFEWGYEDGNSQEDCGADCEFRVGMLVRALFEDFLVDRGGLCVCVLGV
jgi:hypothetical protein